MKSNLRFAVSAAATIISASTFCEIARADVILSDVSRGCYNASGVFACGGSGLFDGNYHIGDSQAFTINPDGSITIIPVGEGRAFSGFDLSGVTGTIVGASITFNSTHPNLPTNGAGDPFAILGLFDYSGNYSALINGAGGAAAFSDLGSGSLYANPLIPTSNDLLVIDLNSAALIDLNAAKGGNFALGGALIGASTGTGTFGNSIGSPATLLTLKIDVPEPVTLSLFGAGLAGAIGARRKRRAV